LLFYQKAKPEKVIPWSYDKKKKKRKKKRQLRDVISELTTGNVELYLNSVLPVNNTGQETSSNFLRFRKENVLLRFNFKE